MTRNFRQRKSVSPELVKKILVYSLLSLLLASLQCSFFARLSICPATPDLMLGLVAAIALLDSREAAAICGIGCGVLYSGRSFRKNAPEASLFPHAYAPGTPDACRMDGRLRGLETPQTSSGQGSAGASAQGGGSHARPLSAHLVPGPACHPDLRHQKAL